MPLDIKQQKWLPVGLNPQDIATRTSCPTLPLPELGKVYPAEHRFRYMQPQFPALLFNSEHCCGKQDSCFNGAAQEGTIQSSRKRFLLFDQSGNQTRLLQCRFPLQFPSSVPVEKVLSKDHAIHEKNLLNEDHVENCYNEEEEEEEESEMHEDTEEIDALLYSDDDDYESDDEVMSTGHSPFLVEQQACNKKTNETDGPSLKRQKLMDHVYRDSSQFTKLKSLSDEKTPESNISSKQETGSGLSDEQSRTDKIHTALRILESVVPGAKGKEALLLIDEAIDYLKLLKQNLNSSKDNNYW